MLAAFTELDRQTRTATVRLRGDLVIATAQQLYGQLRGVSRRREVKAVIVDFAEAGRVDSSGLAVVALGQQMMARGGKTFDLAHLGEAHRSALALLPAASEGVVSQAAATVALLPLTEPATGPAIDEEGGWVQRLGASMLGYGDAAAAFCALVAEVGRQAAQVLTRKKRLPAGALLFQISAMGVDAVGIVGLLGLLLGTTLGFQAMVLLQRFGASVLAADMIGISMVREFGPMMTAIILTGRTGAAIAAELGTMRVRSELDALDAMGVSPVRFLLLPRLLALTCVQPALSLMAMFLGIAGGMLVGALAMHVPPSVFWLHIVDRVTLGDFVHGVAKSVVFAWIIGFAGCHFGLRTTGDATSVGIATTRTVVVGVFFIILVDALAATAGAL
jgi:phospholipid/cholesterol/gamma-HCH transport system permease protein